MWVDILLQAVYLCWITTFAFWFSAWNYKPQKNVRMVLTWSNLVSDRVKLEFSETVTHILNVSCGLQSNIWYMYEYSMSKDTRLAAEPCPLPDHTQSRPFHLLQINSSTTKSYPFSFLL